MFQIKKYHINLLFSLFVLMSVSLACAPDILTLWTKHTDVAGMSCTPNTAYSWTWKCTYKCDKPEKVGDKTQSVYLAGDDLVDSDKAGYEAKCAEKYPEIYSSQGSVISESIVPTATPTPPSYIIVKVTPAENFPPILTGEITFCDPTSHVMNFRFVDGFIPQDYNHKVTLNGIEIKCVVNPSNHSLLSCEYPVSATFPADIQVWRGEQIVNEIKYDGRACFVPEKPKNNPDNPGLDCSQSPMPEGC